MYRSSAMYRSVIFWLGLLLALSVGGATHAAVVLQYHHIDDQTPTATSTSPELFDQHLDFLQREGFRVVPLPALVERLRDGQSLPDKTVALTFDDAYISVYREALPRLKRRNWPFTVFINTDPIDRQWGQFASWEQLREMAAAGATLAGHSASHSHLIRRLNGESEAAWKRRVWADIDRAHQRIAEQTGQSHRLLAYPFGEYDVTLMQLLRERDVAAFGQHSGPLAALSGWQSLQSLPRFPMGGRYGELADFSLKVSSLPLPLQALSYLDPLSGGWQQGEDPVLPVVEIGRQSQNQPVRLRLTLPSVALTSALACYVSGQGRARIERQGIMATVSSPAQLAPGRQRINCTAPAGKGRFYWYSRAYFSTDKQGHWPPE